MTFLSLPFKKTVDKNQQIKTCSGLFRRPVRRIQAAEVRSAACLRGRPEGSRSASAVVIMFEGSEKKLEVILSPGSPGLRGLPEKFWLKLVRACGADIVRRADFSDITAFLLSESSLFVFDHRMIMITCGRTDLPRSFLKLLKIFPEKHIDLVFFQRKNEFFPQSQKTSFADDVQKIYRKIRGRSFQFGFLHDHHFLLFHSDKAFVPEPDDCTLEILMYDSPHWQAPLKIKELKRELVRLFPGFEIQDFLFDPPGWSANGVRGANYYTIHITPDQPFFYISFETNLPSLKETALAIRELFGSKEFDVISFTPRGKEPPAPFDKAFLCGAFFRRVLSCGWTVDYKKFSANKTGFKEAFPLLVK